MVAIGADGADERGEGGRGWKGGPRLTECGLLGPFEVGLLGVVEDAVAEVHSNCVRPAAGMDGVHSGTKLEDSGADVLGNGGFGPMEDIHNDGPAIELLRGLLGSGRVADITGGESFGVGHGGGVSSFGELGLADSLEDFLVFSMAFAGDGERGESLAEDVSVATRLEGTEYLVNDLGGQGWEISGEHRDRRVNGTFLAVAAKDCIVLSFGGLG